MQNLLLLVMLVGIIWIVWSRYQGASTPPEDHVPKAPQRVEQTLPTTSKKQTKPSPKPLPSKRVLAKDDGKKDDELPLHNPFEGD